MNNMSYLQLPIKTFNKSVKLQLTTQDLNFKYLEKGVLYKENFFNFKATKAIQEFKLINSNINSLIHLNQIDLEENLIFAVIYENEIDVRLITKEILQTMKLIPQHGKSTYQLHCMSFDLKAMSVCLTKLV